MWSKISLYKFQELEKINGKNLSDIDKTLFSTCIYYNLTEWQFDNMPPKKAAKKIIEMEKTLSTPIQPIAKKRIGKYFINYNIDEMTFGQYVEIAYFLQMGVLAAAHLIIASASHTLSNKIFNKDFKICNVNILELLEIKHSIKAEYFLNQPIEITLGTALKLIENFNAFNKQYKGLFGLKNGNEESESEVRKIEQDPFNKQYGWIYSAKQVAKHEGISLDNAFRLPVRQGLSALAYLKAENANLEKQLKRK